MTSQYEIEYVAGIPHLVANVENIKMALTSIPFDPIQIKQTNNGVVNNMNVLVGDVKCVLIARGNDTFDVVPLVKMTKSKYDFGFGLTIGIAFGTIVGVILDDIIWSVQID